MRYGTLFVAAAGNSGPYVGSVLEAPGSAAQALSVAAAAKDYDVNHDDTASGDTCAGWKHPRSTSFGDNDCSAGVGDQTTSLSSFSSRGPSGDVWLRPDLAAPGYNIVSAQAAIGTALALNDINRNTIGDPLYATATGTSMAAPAAAGSAALLLGAYRRAYGVDPSGASGVSGLRAPAYALLRAALMNSAGGDLYESRWILTTAAQMSLECPETPDPLLPTFCGFGKAFTDLLADGFGSFTLYEVRNGAADPYVGPLAEGAGKLQLAGAVAALRNGVVVYSAASGTGASAGTGHRDLQGSWQVGAIKAGSSQTQTFVLHSAPGGPSSTIATFSFQPGNPSDGSRAIPVGSTAGSWGVKLPGRTTVRRGGDALVKFQLNVPRTAAPGSYTGVVVVSFAHGQIVRIPVFASVPLHDPNFVAGNAPGPQARVTSLRDVFAKGDTTWPSVAGSAGTGASADWLVYPVELGNRLSSARFSVYDSDTGTETYDLYLYDSKLDLIATTHPFVPPETESGVTDQAANRERGPSTATSPQVLTLSAPPAGRYYLAVNRAKVGGTSSGDFGSLVLTLDEVRPRAADDPVVALTKTGPVTAPAGAVVTYTLSYTNAGPAASQKAKLTDILPSELAFVSASGGGTYAAGSHTVTWNLGTVAAGASGSRTLTARILPSAAPGTVVLNSAEFTGEKTVSPLAAWTTVVAPS